MDLRLTDHFDSAKPDNHLSLSSRMLALALALDHEF